MFNFSFAYFYLHEIYTISPRTFRLPMQNKFLAVRWGQNLKNNYERKGFVYDNLSDTCSNCCLGEQCDHWTAC